MPDKCLTRDALAIYWYNESQRGYVETRGMYFYGYWGKRRLPPIERDGFDLLWPADSIEHSMRHWPQYLNLGIEVLIREWPPSGDWRELVGRALGWFARRDAIVAWCGGEICRAGVNELDGGNLVYAAYSEPA